MPATKIALLGAIAGFTIFLGLPAGRLRNPAPRLRALLNAGAVGILVFLLWDVLAHSVAFLALAAGSILYVVIELLAVGRKMGIKEITTWGLLIGLLAGFLTDAIVTAGGA